MPRIANGADLMLPGVIINDEKVMIMIIVIMMMMMTIRVSGHTATAS